MRLHSKTFWLYFISFFSLHILFTSSIHIPESVLLSSDINSDSFPGFIVLCEGNCTNDIVTQTSYGVGLFGGDMYPKDSNITINQTHPDWYGPDLAFDWLIEKAGNGDIIVLKYAVLGSLSDCTFYNDYLYSLGNVHSVTTICFFEKFPAAPNSETVYNLIIQSEGLFFSGGDQWDYVSLWNNTKVTEGIQYLVNNNRPLSGSSAGLAILGQYVYTAEYVSATSKIALHHPFGPEVTLTNNFLNLPGMSNIITDTHFLQRNRMGRLCVFLARILTNGWGENIQGNINYIHGVGVSQKTGLLLEANGTATIVGLGPVYFLTANTSNIITCEKDSPLSFENFQVYRLVGGRPEPESKNFNFNTWTGVGGNEYYLSATDGVLSSTDGGVYGFGIDYYGDY